MSLIYEAVLLAALLLGGGFAFLAWDSYIDPLLVRPALQLFLLVLVGAYFVSQWSSGGQTLPMKTWRIKVVCADGAPVTAGRATCRYVLAVAGTLLLGMGLIWAFVDRDRQFLHDRLAGTRMVLCGEQPSV